MKTFTSTVICLISILSIGTAQVPIIPKSTSYVDSLNRYYMQAKLPIYISISNAPNSEKETLTPTDYSSKTNEKTPIYMDGHGKHALRHMHGKDGEVLDKFVIYADGFAPKTIIKNNDVPRFKNVNSIYFGKDLKLSLKAKDEMSGLAMTYFSTNKNPYAPYKNDISAYAEGEYIIKYYSTDKVGNTEKVKLYPFIVDLSPPKTYYHIVGIAKGNIISTSTRLYLTSSDSLSGLDKVFYNFDDDEPKMYNGKDLPVAQLSDGHHTLNYYSIDNVKNKAPHEQLKFYLDKTAPIISADVLGDKFIVGSKVYYSGRTKLKLTAVDNKSGVKDVLYAIDNDGFIPYDDPFYLPSKTGKHTVKYFARDNVANDKKHSEYKHVVGIVYVDLTGPTLSHKYHGARFKKGEKMYISGKTNIELKALDMESGLKHIKYKLDGGEETDYDKAINVLAEGAHTITIIGYDNVNNRNMNNFEFIVDNIPSDIFVTYSASATETVDNIPVYPSYTSIFLAGTDAGTECHKISYSLNGQPMQPYNNKISDFKKNAEIELKIIAEDKLENKSEVIIKFKTNSL